MPIQENAEPLSESDVKKKQIDWKVLAKESCFIHLIQQKKKFVIQATVFFLLFYFSLPISTSYFTFLNYKVYGPFNYAYLFAISQFIMTWALCGVYSRRAVQFDILAEQMKNIYNDKG